MTGVRRRLLLGYGALVPASVLLIVVAAGTSWRAGVVATCVALAGAAIVEA